MPTAAGERLAGLPAEVAVSLAVTDEDRKRRKKKKGKVWKDQEEDPISNLIAGEDPEFFGFPYIWVQIGHVVLGSTSLGAACFGGKGLEFALFGVEGRELVALRAGVSLTLIMNFALAVYVFNQEMALGKGRLLEAAGWALKALFLGGVANWQREGRMYKAQKREAENAKEAARAAP